jgi:outer membrane protein OmpA-like peptidoglycan-associated protein
MKLRSALLAATILAAAPIAAKAQPVTGLYVGAGAGANWMSQLTAQNVSFPNVNSNVVIGNNTGGAHINFATGFVGVGSVGWGLGNGLRLEVEGAYRTNKLDGVSGNGFFNNNGQNIPGTGAGGNEQKYSAMFNVLYDFNGLSWPVVPYVGVGVGYTWMQFQNGHIYGNGFAPSLVTGTGFNTLFRTTAGDSAFSYQFIGGLAYQIPAVPGLSLTTEFRFFGLAGDHTTNWQYYATGPVRGGVNTRARITTNDDFNYSLLVGVRYAFNAAPPPPVAVVTPPPAVEAARTYLVFFDWDRADLTDRARQIIAQAAQATTRVQVTRIQVNGYTDLSGTARYNMGLSIRRAQNVANELVRDGVPRGAISIQGFGKTHPLVPTADGVREPQNRRVEIILQ